MMKSRYFFPVLLVLMIPLVSISQELVLQDYATSGKYLNTQIYEDTASAEFKAGTRVFVLKKDGIYLSNTTIVLSNKHLNIRAEYGGTGHYDPTIYLYPGANGNPPGNFADLAGGSIRLTHILLSGYYEPLDSNLDRLQGSLIRLNTSGSGGSIYIDSCILKSVNGQALRTEGKPTTVRIWNSIIADMGFQGTSNFGAGKAIDLRDQDVDTCDVQYSTFVNYTDRVIRHYQAVKGPIRNFMFNHNTVVNCVSYHGFLSLGRVDSSGNGILQIKNNVLVDHFALGADTAYLRQAEFGDPVENDPTNGNPRMAWVLTNPNMAAKWDISNNYYVVTDSGQAMFNLAQPNGPFYQNAGPALTWNMNKVLAQQGKDTLNTFKKVNLTLANTPPLMTNMIRWIYRPRADGGDGKQKNGNDPNFTKDSPGHWRYDYNRKSVEYYFDTLNAKIQATPTTITKLISTDGKVVGDPRWGAPTVVSDPSALITVDGDKDAFYGTLTSPLDGYVQLRSSAFNNNGAPKGDADLSAKVWTAWDDTWFYFYAEVMDDTISGNGVNSYQDDGLELKFDAQAKDSVANSIFGANLTILGGAGSDSLLGIPNNQKQWARKTITGGYALELAINWPAIGTTEKVSVGVDSVFGLAINFHDNDGNLAIGGGRQASVQWAAVMDDAVWNTPKYLGTVMFLSGNKLLFDDKNNMTGRTNPYKYDGTDIPLSVKLPGLGIPTEYGVGQNYPNPFNPATTIKYQLPVSGVVTLKVYNFIGQEVATLVNTHQDAAYYTVTFNASRLASGVYFYTLRSGSFVQTKKMLLVK